MRHLVFMLFIFWGLVIAMISGCSQNNLLEPTDEAKPTTPGFMLYEIILPEKITESKDSVAQKIVGFVELANSINQYQQFLLTPDSLTEYSQKNGIPTWQIVRDLDTLTIFTYIAENKDFHTYEWLIIVDGILNGISVDSLEYIEVRQWKKGYPNGMNLYRSMEVFNTDGSLSDSYMWGNDFNGDFISESRCIRDGIPIELRFRIKLDRTAELTVINHQIHVPYNEYIIKWTADGNGQWWQYDHYQQLIGSGGW
ncbi:hypothetical protein JXJ21_00140 [candidate division KSB1 bacterium]|nr:hypothetical protein [candidate division KSB1 bacterium]